MASDFWRRVVRQYILWTRRQQDPCDIVGFALENEIVHDVMSTRDWETLRAGWNVYSDSAAAVVHSSENA